MAIDKISTNELYDEPESSMSREDNLADADEQGEQKHEKLSMRKFKKRDMGRRSQILLHIG